MYILITSCSFLGRRGQQNQGGRITHVSSERERTRAGRTHLSVGVSVAAKP